MRQCLLEAQLEKLKDGIPEKTVTQFVDPVGAAAGTNTETVTYTLPAVPPPTDEQMATIRRLLEGVEGVHEETITHPCYYIVWEECTKLFNGAKSPEDTAKAIQERLSIFLAERTP